MSSVYDSFGTEIARSFKDFRMATPKSARKPFRDATNTMSSRPIDMEEPSWSTGRPKKRMKGGQRVDLGNSIRTPTESSVLLERLSKTIDVGVNELKSKNSKFDTMLKTAKKDLSEVRVRAQTPLGRLDTRLENEMATSGWGEPALRTPSADELSARMQPSMSDQPSSNVSSTSAVFPPPQSGELKHSFQLVCAQNLIEAGIADIGAGSKKAAREKLTAARENLESVMANLDDQSRERSEVKQPAVRFCTPEVTPEVESLPTHHSTALQSEEADCCAEAPGHDAHLATGDETSVRKRKEKPTEGVNLEDIFARAWNGASPAMFTPLQALTPLPISTQFIQGFSFPTQVENGTGGKKEKNTRDANRNSKGQTCVVM